MERPYTQEISVSISSGVSTGTQSEPCNPVNSSVLRKVQAYAADDADVSSFKVELLRTDPLDPSTPTYIQMYESSDGAIPDDAAWHDCDAGELDIPLHFALDGNFTWRVTTDVPTNAAMTVKLRRTISRNG